MCANARTANAQRQPYHTVHCTSPLVCPGAPTNVIRELGECLVLRIIVQSFVRDSCIVAVSSVAEIQVVVTHHVKVFEPHGAPCRRRPWLLFARCESAIVCRGRSVSKRCVAIGVYNGNLFLSAWCPVCRIQYWSTFGHWGCKNSVFENYVSSSLSIDYCTWSERLRGFYIGLQDCAVGFSHEDPELDGFTSYTVYCVLQPS